MIRTPAREVAAARRDLTLIVVVIVGLARLLDGPLVWLVAVLLLAATLLGTLQVLGQAEGPAAEHGVPIESLILPAVAAIGCLGAIRPRPARDLARARARRDGVPRRPDARASRSGSSRRDRDLTEEDRSEVLVLTLLVAFVAFTGAGSLVPGGLAGGFGQPVPPLALQDLVLLAAADALVAGLLGYRAAALRVTTLRDALWSAATYAIAIAIGAAALRAMAIPRLIGPALLMLVFYLWDAFHGAAPARRRDPRWIWQTGLLVGLGVVVVGWNLLVRG